MLNLRFALGLCAALAVTVSGCGDDKKEEKITCTSPNGACIEIKPGADANTRIQEALLEAKPNDVIFLRAGKYNLTTGLSLFGVDGVTIRGEGSKKTVLNFKGQTVGAEGFTVEANDVTFRDLAVEDTKGDGIKITGGRGVTIRNVRVEWTNGPDEKNGPYGLYPVGCTDVIIEGSVVKGASDAGIYVGDSHNVIVRNNRAEDNVAGIEIENTIGADVYDNIATKNTGGILVFSLTGRKNPNGHQVRVYNNKMVANNTPNFAPAGNIVAQTPTGTGLMILAHGEIEVFNNEFRDNDTVNALILSYRILEADVQDDYPEFYPEPETIYIHGNTFIGGGENPDPNNADIKMIALLLGGEMPDILWDGIRNENVVDSNGELPDTSRICVENNGEATFADLVFDINTSTPTNIIRNIADYTCSHPRLPSVTIN